jgi:hypothetical protein
MFNELRGRCLTCCDPGGALALIDRLEAALGAGTLPAAKPEVPRKKEGPTMDRLARLVARLPERHSLRMGMEWCQDNDDNREMMLVASIYEEPPEGGWASRGACFNHPFGEPCPEQWAHGASIRGAVNAMPRERKAFNKLVLGMLRRYLERLKQRAGTPPLPSP